MTFKQSFTTAPLASSLESDGRNISFVANSGKMMDNGQTVDLSTLRVPLMDGSHKLVSQLSDDDDIALPLLIDHIPSIEYQAGRITSLWVDDDNGMMARAKLSNVEAGDLVLQLAKDNALTNSFSINIDYETAPGHDGVIREANLDEISVVFKGMDPRAAFKSLYSKDGNMSGKLMIDMSELDKIVAGFKLDDDEKQKLLASIQSALQSVADSISSAVDDVSDDSDNDDNDDNGAPSTSSNDAPPEPNQSSNSKTGQNGGAFGKPIIIRTPTKNDVKGNGVSLAKTLNTRKTYLDSNEAFNDYAKFLFSHKSEDGIHPGHDMKRQWAEYAAKKLNEHSSFGIDQQSVEDMIPTSVIDSINDVFNTQGTGVWQSFNKTGLDTPPTIGENEIGLDRDDGRAHGYTVSDYGTEKKKEAISLRKRTFELDMVYKYTKMHRGDLRRTQNPGALLRYILSEMPARLINTLERAAIINSVDKTAQPQDWQDMAMFRSIYDDSLQTDTTAGDRTIPGNLFALTYVQQPGETLAETFSRASSKIQATGAKTLVTSEQVLADIRWSKDNENRTLLPIGAAIEPVLGVSQTITPAWWFERDSAKALGIIYVGGQYDTYGDNGPEAFTNFALRTNENEFLQEIYTGGGLRTVKSAVVVKAAPAQNKSASFGYTGTGNAQNNPTVPANGQTAQTGETNQQVPQQAQQQPPQQSAQ